MHPSPREIAKVANMLLPDNIHPEKTVYFNGAIVLEALTADTEQKMNLFDLHQQVNKKWEMSLPMLVLSLDWLYLIDAAKLTQEGEVKLCISNN